MLSQEKKDIPWTIGTIQVKSVDKLTVLYQYLLFGVTVLWLCKMLKFGGS